MKNVVKLVALFFVMLTVVPLTALVFSINQDKFVLYDQFAQKEMYVSKRDYLIGAVASEMPASFHIEAMKAQAAAIYTNAIRLSSQKKTVAILIVVLLLKAFCQF